MLPDSRRGVRHDVRSVQYPAVQRLDCALFGDDAAPAQYGERRIGIAHAGHDADLLPAKPALVQGGSAMASGTRHDELALGVVALEALAQIRLVQLDGYARTGHELRQIPFEAFQQTAAHEPRGTQRHLATRRASTQCETIHEAFHVHHPLGDRQLRPTDQGIPRLGERAPAVSALPTLGAVRIMPLPYDADGTAARTC